MQEDKGKYSLRKLALARFLAESTVAGILTMLAPVLFFSGTYKQLELHWQLGCLVVSVIAIFFLIAAGMVTHTVKIDREGITTISFLQRHFVSWAAASGLCLKNSYGWKRYCLITPDKELSFPILLDKVDELVERIRSRLPNQGRLNTSAGIYTISRFSLMLAFIKELGFFIFIVCFWVFSFTQLRAPQSHGEDIALLFMACFILSALLVVRCLLLSRAITLVKLDTAGLQGYRFMGKFHIAWSDIKAVMNSWPALPEGILLRSGKQWFLVSSDLERFDELAADIAAHLPGKLTPKL